MLATAISDNFPGHSGLWYERIVSSFNYLVGKQADDLDITVVSCCNHPDRGCGYFVVEGHQEITIHKVRLRGSKQRH